MRPKGSAEELERRRVRAVELVKEGHGPSEAARMVGAHRRSVQRWCRRREKGGRKALKATPHPGRKSKLTRRQKERLSLTLLQGAQRNGFGTDLWTCPRIERVIRKRFGVSYHVDHIGRLLHSMGWTLQKPERKAYERDEEAVQRWVSRDWPRIKKVATG